MKTKFAEVLTDYTDPDGNISIDAYPDFDENSENGRTVALVSPDGEVIKGTNPTIKADDLECLLVKDAIAEAIQRQHEIKQELVDKALEQIKKDVATGDLTAIDELLMFVPTKNLKGFLPENL